VIGRFSNNPPLKGRRFGRRPFNSKLRTHQNRASEQESAVYGTMGGMGKSMSEIASRLASRLFDGRLIENQHRSAFIEAMIEPYLEPYGWCYAGAGWSGWDFDRKDGRRLEVKQSAAHQTWSEFRNLRTRGIFDIAARKGYFYDGGSKWAPVPGRPAQTYVFAWNPTFGSETDHRNPDQWEFYVVAETSLPQHKTIGLSEIKKLTAFVKLPDLALTVDQIAALSLPKRAGE